MSLLIGGIVSVVLGVIGFSLWWSDFLMIIKGGEVVNKWIGITSKQVMSDALETAIAS